MRRRFLVPFLLLGVCLATGWPAAPVACALTAAPRAQESSKTAASPQEQSKPAAAASPQTQEQPKAQAAAPAPAKNDYSNPDFWLCRPGLPREKDACAIDLTTTIVAADGKLTRQAWAANPNAAIDCFYVYPTVSNYPGPNSDMIPAPEEKLVIEAQFARFASECRPFAPMYRQATLTAVKSAFSGHLMFPDRVLAYNDILDAWNYYLDHDNRGRGVVLIGHSQGANVLTYLITSEIDGKPIQSRIVSALLLGTNLPVPQGKDVGGAFQNMTLCRAAAQTGCVISYVTYRVNVPPPANAMFGKVQGDGMMAACTNPASLAGGSGELHAYLNSKRGFIAESAEPKPWTNPPRTIDTPFVSVPGLLSAECVSNEHGSYLAVTVHSQPAAPGDLAGPRTNEIVGDVVVGGTPLNEWGLHLIDVQVAMGNLLDIVGQESKAYLNSQPKLRVKP